MKELIKKAIKRYALKHEISAIHASENQDITFVFNNLKPIIGKRYLVIKNRDTGRRIQKAITTGESSFTLNELSDVHESGKFDIYMKYSFLRFNFSRRSAYKKGLTLFELIDEENNRKLKSFKTVNNNLSLVAQHIMCDHSLKEIKAMGHNFYLTGTFAVFNDNPISAIELIVQRRDTKKCYGYKCEFDKQEDNMYRFTGVLFVEKLQKDLVINSRWDLFIQVRDAANTVIYKELVSAQHYRTFEKEEQRYLVNALDNEQNIVSLYATMGKESLALWYTDEAQFKKTYGIAKGKSVFNEICEQGKMDEHMVFFESFLGKNYSGNPKYIYEEMLRDEKYKNYKFVWSYSGNNVEEIPGKPIIVDRDTEDYYKYLAHSKYWVSNIVFPVHRKRKGNVYLQTWHGTPLKKLGFDIDIEGPETLARENFYIESRNWDYLIAANRYSSDIFKRAFKFDKKMLEVGYPANDVFYREDLEGNTKRLKQKLNIPLDKKVILYAPTWRDNAATHSWEFSFQLQFDLEEFYKHLKDDYVLILRMHHLIADALEIKEEYKSFVLEMSKYDDIQELYTISDILITDYSSVFFDYANSRKPILFFAYDFELYKENIRGFYLDMTKHLPGPVIQSGPELLEAIQNINQVSDKYKEKYDEFYNTFCSLEDGSAARRVISQVFEN
ncbi:CDP-glycerol glycerophosphotransferase family protein [Microbacteriaceae bacterium 4G12]